MKQRRPNTSMNSVLARSRKRTNTLSIVGIKGQLMSTFQKNLRLHAKLSRELGSGYFLSFQKEKVKLRRGRSIEKNGTNRGIIKPYVNTSNYIKRIAFQLRKVPHIKIVKKLNETVNGKQFKTKRHSLPKPSKEEIVSQPYSDASTLMSIVSLSLDQPLKKKFGISTRTARPRTALRSERSNIHQRRSQSRHSSRQLRKSLVMGKQLVEKWEVPRVWEKEEGASGEERKYEFRVNIKPKQSRLDFAYGYTDMLNL
eukprot:TRINITY_DN3057_c0_g1_i12.p1 TRINITY_DN3057_c0_g1~~TRINITY_DN3057_c0_g1_i12.p1  ORF type:complete len:255 (-),score=29.00 TRINITY_DN3057_c0_g1_i12:135-899(-)